MKFRKPVVFSLLLFAAVSFVMSCSSVDEPPVEYLENIEVAYITPSQAPVVDGVLEPIWQAASVTQMLSDQGSDYNPSNQLGLVNVSAMSDSTYVYISASWKDESRNVRFLQLIWNNQFGWNRPNVGKEDNISFFFTEEGGSTTASDPNCFAMCHTETLVMVNETGAPVDGWYWRASLTNPLTRAMDLWFADSLDADTSFLGVDAEVNPGFAYNAVDSAFIPLFRNSFDTVINIIVGEDTTRLFDNGEYLMDTDTVAFTFPPVELDSVLVPSFILYSNPTGSCWDVQAKGDWDEVSGRWTVEFKRLLNTGNADDIEFVIGEQIRIVVAIGNNTKHAHTGFDPVILEF